MIIDPKMIDLPRLPNERALFAIRRAATGEVIAASASEWTRWADRHGPIILRTKRRVYHDGSSVVVLCSFFGHSPFQSDRGFFWRVTVTTPGLADCPATELYADSESDALKICEEIAAQYQLPAAPPALMVN